MARRKLHRIARCFSVSMVTLAACMSAAAWADDIEIYGRETTGVRPNVLFIVDISESMDYDPDGNPVGASSEASPKIEILRSVMSDVLADNANRINAGILFFNHRTSGVRWPVSALTGDASLIDPTLPSGTTVEQALNEHLKIASPDNRTNYAAPFIEATRYFRGESVWINDYGSWRWTHTYPDFDQSWGQYQTWFPLGANPAAYQSDTPAITWTEEPSTSNCYSYEYDFFYSYGQSDNTNCTGDEEITSQNCTYHEPQAAWTEYYCDKPKVCTGTLSQGECLNGYWADDSCSDDELSSREHSAVDGYTQCLNYYETTQSVFHWNGADYISPISDSCQGNYIVFLSDGVPTTNTNLSTAWNTAGLAGKHECTDTGAEIFGDSNNESSLCVAELVEFLANEEQQSDIPGSVVNTFTIGFGLTGDEATTGNAFLELLAQRGGGSFFSATDAASLKESLTSAIGQISGETDEFTGLSIDVRNNAFSTDNRAFVNLFQPSGKRSWKGNVKGYFLSDNGLLDVDGETALDEDGRFSAEARSFWSDTADGNVVSAGGASEALVEGGRTLFTYTGTTSPVGVDLSQAEHALSSDNTALTSDLLSVSDETTRNEVLAWIQTAPMADPLHSKPVLAKYADDSQLLFTMTNQGFLHAFDASTPRETEDHTGGAEQFAFIPQALLGNLADIRSDVAGAHIYGLDGSLTLRHEDSDRDGLIDSDEIAVLYFGMRRGGKNYYALDVSSPATPKLLWRIDGGIGDFAALAQTWSRPVLTTLRNAGQPTKVLIFGAGYDAALDEQSTLTTSAVGNAIFVVDADTGSRLAMIGGDAATAGADQMDYAIPSDISVIDLNANGYADTLYFGDTGSQLWRVSFAEPVDADGNLSADFDDGITVQRIGEFQSASGYSPRFFYPPAVALIQDNSSYSLSVVIGSGLRNNPLNTSSTDWVYMLRDPLASPISATVKAASLYDITENLLQTSENPQTEWAALDAAKGWRLELSTAEKSLSAAVIFDEVLHFTTYQPTEVVSGECSASSGAISRYYRFSVRHGIPLEDSNDDDKVDGLDRVLPLENAGIPTSPTLMFPEGGDSVDVYVDKHKVSEIRQRVRTLYWHDQQ